MAFDVTNTFAAGAVVAAADVNENFDDVVAKINGGLTTANLSASAGILNAQLANSHYEMFVRFTIGMFDGAAPTALQLVDYFPLPGLVADGSYTIEDCDYYITDRGATANTTITIDSGLVTAGAFVQTTVHVNAQTIAFGTDAQDVNASFTVAQAVIPASANNRVLRMTVTLGNPDIISVIGDKVVVVLKLRRTNGLRAV